MRRKIGIILLAASLLGALTFAMVPASAATHYVMEGGGNLVRTSGPGLAATGPSTTTVYTFATLPIVGHGQLVGQTVAGTYNCPSNVKITGVGANFSVVWNFTCNRTAGIGPNPIKGSFSGKYPVFKGTFSPYVNGVKKGTAKSTCSGAAVPTAVSSGHITRLFFAGFCVSPT